jgi:16S rRNA C967 or C1407 C5-methylase (RsmB/RsmF family)/NOL1/NOP2/fmu family ribosome biogenesis protein
MSETFPPAFEERMKRQLLGEFDNFKRVHEEEAPVSIRINPEKNSLPASNNVPWTAFGQYIDKRPVFTLDPALHAGAYYVQEASSMSLEQVVKQSVDLAKPLRVLDLCAAPGGKSTHLLSLINRNSLLVSNEVIRSRATILSENLQKWGSPNVIVTNNDPRDFLRLKGYFDLILVDAPCSGEGLFRKDPGAKAEWSVENAAHCSQRQHRILQDIWPALRTDGVLIYCTCTYNPAENSAALGSLNEVSEPVLLKFSYTGPSGTSGARHSEGQFYPHKIKGEGFFISAIRKVSEENPTRIKSKPLFNYVPKKITERLNEWVLNPSQFDFIIQDDLILMLPVNYGPDIEFMIKELKVITKGTAIASLKHDKLIPEHAFALSTELNKDNFMMVDVGLEQALNYLKKGNLVLDDHRRGFALIRYQGLPLGWVNLLGSRINNLYPSAWRIRLL